MSARVSKRVLRACRAAQISGYSNRIPDDRGAAHPLRGQHDAHKIGASFSEKLQVVNCIKRVVANLNRTFMAVHPLEVYYLNQACRGLTTPGIGPVYFAPLYLQRCHGIGNFFRHALPLVPPNPVERGQSSGPREVAYRWQDPDRYRWTQPYRHCDRRRYSV